MKKRKVLLITGSRGEYGYIRPIIKLIKEDECLEYEVLATNMHLLPKFGCSINEFKKDDIRIEHELYNTLDGYNNITMAKNLGLFLLQLPEIFAKSKPDVVLISGDRGEHLMAAIAAAHLNIPVAHIQAGEISGNIDGIVRHAITKMSHIHFAANKDAYDRVKKLGEQEFRIFNTGAPLVDELLDHEDQLVDQLVQKYNLPLNKKLFLVVNHSVTEESNKSSEQMRSILKSTDKFDATKVVVMPNSDAGSLEIRKQLSDCEKKDDYRIFYNLTREEYLSFIKIADVMVGNSSSGLLEAPTFKTAVINIGQRQKDRVSADNVIHVSDYRQDKITSAIKRSLSLSFRESLQQVTNPYGTEKASRKIIEILKNINIDKDLINKKMSY